MKCILSRSLLLLSTIFASVSSLSALPLKAENKQYIKNILQPYSNVRTVENTYNLNMNICKHMQKITQGLTIDDKKKIYAEAADFILSIEEKRAEETYERFLDEINQKRDEGSKNSNFLLWGDIGQPIKFIFAIVDGEIRSTFCFFR